MTLFSYLDHKYRKLNLELQVNYTIAKEAELKAAYELIQWQRTLFKFLTIPLLFLKYILINLHILNSPIVESEAISAPNNVIPIVPIDLEETPNQEEVH